MQFQSKELFSYIARWKYRNNHQRCSMKKDFLRNFTKFTRKQLTRVSFLIKGLQLYYGVFPWSLHAKLLRIPFLQNTFRRLLLEINLSSQKNKWLSNSKEFLIRSQSLFIFSLKRLSHILYCHRKYSNKSLKFYVANRVHDIW